VSCAHCQCTGAVSVMVHLPVLCAACSVDDEDAADVDRPSKKKKGSSLQTRVGWHVHYHVGEWLA